MDLQDEVRLSFYREIADVDKRHGVVLVQHTDTGKVYVKKTLTRYDISVFEFIRDGIFPGVPVIHELIESYGTLIVIEDYINGQNIDELLTSKLFSTEETKVIISSLCDILHPFHSHNPPIIHRDIKGSNVIIDNKNDIYLIDFDASKRVSSDKRRDTELIGTEFYAAPEQYGFGQSDQRTDVYALGILMQKLLTDKYPSEIEYSGDLSDVITKATALDPENRYQDTQSLKAAIQTSSAKKYSKEPTGSALKKLLSHLPYPIRELPGFRSGNPLFFGVALAWYLFLFIFGFFAVSYNQEYTPQQSRFYDLATFCLLFIPTLYLGNYLGIRDRLPWSPSAKKSNNMIRICIGVILSLLLVLSAFTLFAVMLDY